MVNPRDEKQLNRLLRAAGESRRKLQVFRENRLEALRQYVGRHYSREGAGDKVPVNLIKLYTSVVRRHLVASTPRCLVGTRHGSLKTVAFDMQEWVNHRLGEVGFQHTLRRAVLDALFSIGVVKVGLAESDLSTAQDAGEPFADVVDLDDWVHDMSAKRWDQVAYAGNRYRLPLEFIRESGLFDRKAAAKLGPEPLSAYDERGAGRAEALERGQGEELEHEDHAELWDLWLPRENLVITVPAGGESPGGLSGPPLRIVEWAGPEQGPYHVLGLGEVPNNVMHSAPVHDLLDLHDLANRLWRKLGRQAERQKTVLGVRAQGTDDGERILKADDGEALRVDDPDSAREYRFGGIDERNFAFALQVKQLFAYFAGNLDALGGLGPQADTLGQDKMLSQTASMLVNAMQDEVINFSRGVLQSLCWYWWSEPFSTYEVEKTIPGTRLGVTAKITPEMREASFLELNFDIDPFSMQNDTPQSRLASLNRMLQEVLLPALPMIEGQGMTLAWEPLLRKMAAYMNMPDLEEILIFQAPSQGHENQGPRGEPPRMPGSTNRTYTRVNRPGMTSQGQDQVMQQMLLGGGNSQQKAAVGRPVG